MLAVRTYTVISNTLVLCGDGNAEQEQKGLPLTCKTESSGGTLDSLASQLENGINRTLSQGKNFFLKNVYVSKMAENLVHARGKVEWKICI